MAETASPDSTDTTAKKEGNNAESEDERLRSASLAGSIHELQGGEVEDDTETLSSEMIEKLLLDPGSSIKDQSLREEEDEDDEDDKFEDARETLQRSSSSSQDAGVVSLLNSAEWRRQRKHVFILSEAGKPVFSLHGDEDELASLMAVMQAMAAYAVDMNNDSLRAFNVGDENDLIVFLNKGPLIFVAVSRGAESITQLIVQLTYLYNQLLSVLTQTQLTRIFERRKGFDLRRMIAGSERLLRSLCRAIDQPDPCFLLSAVRVLALPPAQRDAIDSAIVSACGKVKNSDSNNSVVFAILMAENRLVTMARLRKYHVHPADLHLIFNLVNTTESFKHSETWTPICLPKFDSSGFMHAHVSYLTEASNACLMMLTVERDIFFHLSEAKKRIVENLEKTGSIGAISEALRNKSLTTASIGLPEIRHFLCKSKSVSQYVAPELQAPYFAEDAKRRLFDLYLQLQNSLHSYTRPLKLQYRGEEYENVLGWVTQSFEVYAAFAPTMTKAAAIEAVNKLLRWCKKEESSLFILNAPTI